MCGPWLGSWGMFPGILIPIMLFAFVFFMIVRGMRWRGPPWAERHGPPGESPLDILKRRYAKGEISQEDFDRMKKEIES